MSKEEVNRKLAEWVTGETFCQCIQSEGGSIHGYCRDNSGFENLQAVGSCWSCKKMPQWRDFYTDEAANAMLLEKMPRGVVLKDDFGNWNCRPDGFRNLSKTSQHPDRKTAIILAALALIHGESNPSANPHLPGCDHFALPACDCATRRLKD